MRVRKDGVVESQEVSVLAQEFATIVDSDGSTYYYIGKAAIGSAQGSALWQIKKIVISGNVTTTTWADGDDNFDNVWTNRVSLSYS